MYVLCFNKHGDNHLGSCLVGTMITFPVGDIKRKIFDVQDNKKMF